MKWIKRLFYEPKHEQEEEKVTDAALTRSIVVSVIGILVCMACMFGLTWAWFSSSVMTDPNKITAAKFDLKVTVQEEGVEQALSPKEDGWYELDQTKVYRITLVKQGTAKSGFCLLSVRTSASSGCTAYITDTIPQVVGTPEDESAPFVFKISQITEIKFTSMWGQRSEDSSYTVIQNNGEINIGTPAGKPAETPTDDTPKDVQDNTPSDTQGTTSGDTSSDTSGGEQQPVENPESSALPENNGSSDNSSTESTNSQQSAKSEPPAPTEQTTP